jgi:bifunctional DNase/RNase
MRAHVLAVWFAAACASAPRPAPVTPLPPRPPAEPSEPTGAPANYIEMKPDRVVQLGDSGALLLVDVASNSVVPIFIGGTEAASIEGRLTGEPPIRPLTHDLLDHVLQKLHASLVQAQVDELRESAGGGTFIGSIYVRANGRVFKLDARPSDAIALAIGSHVPIFVAQRVIDQVGQRWDQLQNQLFRPPETST